MADNRGISLEEIRKENVDLVCCFLSNMYGCMCVDTFMCMCACMDMNMNVQSVPMQTNIYINVFSLSLSLFICVNFIYVRVFLSSIFVLGVFSGHSSLPLILEFYSSLSYFLLFWRALFD